MTDEYVDEHLEVPTLQEVWDHNYPDTPFESLEEKMKSVAELSYSIGVISAKVAFADKRAAELKENADILAKAAEGMNTATRLAAKAEQVSGNAKKLRASIDSIEKRIEDLKADNPLSNPRKLH